MRRIVFAEPGRAVLETAPDPAVPADGALIQTRYTCISAGTELAKLDGRQDFPFPAPIGNRAVGRVLEVGPRCKQVQAGDLVFTHALHADPALSNALLAPLPPALDRPEAALLGLGLVALTGLRVATPEIGDTAVVNGAGLVGQLLAQLLTLNGVRPIVVDPVAGRLAIAQQCGAWQTATAGTDAVGQVRALTDGRGAEHIFECSGVPAAAEQAVGFAAQSANLVLVGSPRGAHRTDMTPFLNAFHLWRPDGDLRLMGAHEWKVPLYPVHGAKHSQARNLRTLAELAESGRLQLAPLLSRVFKPQDCQQAYDNLRRDRDTALGAVFAWQDQ